MEKRITRVAEVEILDDTFIVRYFDGVVARLNDVETIYKLYADNRSGRALRVMVNIRSTSSIDKPAREYSQKVELPSVAEAFVITNWAQRLLINTYALFAARPNPVKSLWDEEKAQA